MLGEKADFIIDGGKTSVGLESTVLDLSRDPPAILRPGGTSREAIEALIGPVEIPRGPPMEGGMTGDNKTFISPGQLKSHYSPRTPLFLRRNGAEAADEVAAGEGWLYFSAPKGREKIPPGRIRVLSETGDLREAAANLFDMLHELDSLGLALIRAEEAPETGLGLAINDRLRRAASR
jgi:L-threonylcarbamoyladenylate synthase